MKDSVDSKPSPRNFILLKIRRSGPFRRDPGYLGGTRRPNRAHDRRPIRVSTVLDPDKTYNVKYEISARVRRHLRVNFCGMSPLNVPAWPANATWDNALSGMLLPPAYIGVWRDLLDDFDWWKMPSYVLCKVVETPLMYTVSPNLHAPL